MNILRDVPIRCTETCSKLTDDLQSTRDSEHVPDVVRIYSEMFGIRCTDGRCGRFPKLSEDSVLYFTEVSVERKKNAPS